MRGRAGLILAVVAFFAAGCRGAAGDRMNATSGRDGTIAGRLWMIGGPPPGRRLLEHTGIRVHESGHAVAGTTTDARGRFRLVLAPGSYRLTLTDGSGLLPKRVHVAANTTGRVHLTLSVR